MINQCIYKGTTPLNFCFECSLFLETCCYVVSTDGYAMGAECGDYYLCSKCTESCVFREWVNQ